MCFFPFFALQVFRQSHFKQSKQFGMGIDGLLKHLKPCMKEKNLEEYRGQRVAVDTYAWLHKIIKGQCGKEIITGKDPMKYVNDCIRRAEKITKAGIDLILVFDGGVLPRKLNEEETRRKRREQNFQKGRDAIEKGNMDQGVKRMIDAIDVSPDVAYKLIEELKAKDYKFIVAPYEADAQLAYLSRVGIVDIIITEDSDLLAFGAKKILYKLDFTTLNGEEIELENIRDDKNTGFNWFTHNMFLTTCIMAGCDYLDQIKGVGMKLAQKVISKNTTLKKALAELSQSKQIPQSYEDNFMKALLTFRFQRVYCPMRKECVSVNEMNLEYMKEIKNSQPEYHSWGEQVLDSAMIDYCLKLSPDENHPDWQFLGKVLPKNISIKVAEGEINPVSFSEYDFNCLDKLKYKKELNIGKKSSSTQPPNNILKYLRPIERKNNQQFKSLKNRSINKEQYTVFNKEDKIEQSFANNGMDTKKKSLKFNDNDSDENSDREVISEEQEHEENSNDMEAEDNESIDLISSSPNHSHNIFTSSECEQIKETKTPCTLKMSFDAIQSSFFQTMFDEKFFTGPFGRKLT